MARRLAVRCVRWRCIRLRVGLIMLLVVFSMSSASVRSDKGACGVTGCDVMVWTGQYIIAA